MGTNRVFFPQEALDTWVVDERVMVEDDILTLKPEGRRFKLQSAVRFVTEVGGGGDARQLVGKVKTRQQLAELGGELCANSVLLDEDAYDVIEGFLGELIQEPKTVATGDSLSAATRAATGDKNPKKDIDPLTEWFLQKP